MSLVAFCLNLVNETFLAAKNSVWSFLLVFPGCFIFSYYYELNWKLLNFTLVMSSHFAVLKLFYRSVCLRCIYWVFFKLVWQIQWWSELDGLLFSMDIMKMDTMPWKVIIAKPDSWKETESLYSTLVPLSHHDKLCVLTLIGICISERDK